MAEVVHITEEELCAYEKETQGLKESSDSLLDKEIAALEARRKALKFVLKSSTHLDQTEPLLVPLQSSSGECELVEL